MTLANDTISPADFEHEIGALKMEAEAFDGVEITAYNAPAVRDIIARATALSKKVEAARKAAKQPHLDAGKAIDAEYKVPLASITDLATLGKRLLQPFLIAEQRRAQEEAEAARKKAEALRDDAMLAERAEQQAKVATKAAEASGRVQSHSGLARAASLRTRRFATVTDGPALVAHYASHPSMVEEALRLANADIRAAKGEPITIPGVRVEEVQEVA